MSISHLRKPQLPILVGAAMLSLAAVAAPVAHADAVDAPFLGALQAHNIDFANDQDAIAAARQVCNELEQGRQKPDVASDVAANTNLDGYHAGYFVGLSIAAYCPRHRSSS